jgi:hypothetical protein
MPQPTLTLAGSKPDAWMTKFCGLTTFWNIRGKFIALAESGEKSNIAAEILRT